ncbi:hypothetical protein E5161_16480 [Cohnella pontilimi]|uniref:N-acylglucosamine 2-epimerase n=1 Tax=Cohnella pontilimi TaxID=2564100 RepID=A0A4U0F7S9_9BACL|nr:AGE family epimerase/isomerase [Cohnella pontilimi]TJY40743.1 hypothetical protein E5161_16480 [Cohnella pontilimi]
MDFPIHSLSRARDVDGEAAEAYLKYLDIRAAFLIGRFRKHPDFPGVHTGYNSITGIEFAEEDNLPYGWINGRGVSAFCRFADAFPHAKDELMAFAGHTVSWLEKHLALNDGHIPFLAERSGMEKQTQCPCPKGYKSYSDLYGALAFVEYGARVQDKRLVALGVNLFDQAIDALKANRFVPEPDPIFEDRLFENPYSIALDTANDFYKLLGDARYLQMAADLTEHLLDAHYAEEAGAFVEFASLDGKPLRGENGDYIVDPGHSVEFCSFALEFARLAVQAGQFGSLAERIRRLAPKLLLWNVEKGWNRKHPGMFKSFEAVSGQPVNRTMPWWILPETMLGLLLGYECTKEELFLEKYVDAHNAYFGMYMNEKTNFGPFQNIDGDTGLPVDIVPACKFQDPEFHAGKNILTCTQVMERIGLGAL